jgi:TetR/AcrR family transcriptional repressor of nem operon
MGCYGFGMSVTTDTRRSILDAGQRIMSHKGYAAVGLTEVLSEARVPKGSFYHYFESKDAFGEAMMKAYFVEYLADMDRIFADRAVPAADRLLAYLQQWRETQTLDDCQGKCLAVKLGAEVADLSDTMRRALVEGTDGIVDRLADVIGQGIEDKSLVVDADPQSAAEDIYTAWLGASIMAKIHRDAAALDRAMAATRRLLHL